MKTLGKFSVFTFIILFLFVVLSDNTTAQVVRVIPERDSILVGQQIQLTLSVQIPPSVKTVLFPDFENDTITSSIEIIGKATTDTIRKDNDREINKRFIITSFDTGKIAIPPMPFGFISDQNPEPSLLFSDSVFLNVQIIDVDTTQAIMDIRNPWGIPFQWKEYLPQILIGILVLLLIIAGLYYYMRRKKGLPLFPARIEPVLPPDEEALQALNKIKKEKIWRAGLIKDYYTVLTDTIRRYIDRRFNINAPELTTDETLKALVQQKLDAENVDKLKQLLETADMVKFAKAQPLPTVNEQCLDLAFDFVLQTKPVEPTTETNETPTNHSKTTEI